MTPALTRDRILDIAQRLIQTRGFSAFSYADIATEVGIRKASIHHHFPTKGELAVALMQRYRARFEIALAEIEQAHARLGPRLEAYQELFSNVLRDGHRLCMCGMLAADFDALPEEVRTEVLGFFDSNEAWLARVLAEGKRRGQTSYRGSANTQARVLLSALEGAMLVARTYRDVDRFTVVAKRVIDAALAAR
jgi:TetR/AcrR family transcriptional regulator, transcriptional repressor for nem operon